MIITVTINPAVDKTASVTALERGGLNRLRGIVRDAGGKGINVSKMISALGGRSLATGFAGGAGGELITSTLASMNIKSDFVRVANETRTNLKLVEDSGAVTELNEPGAPVTSGELSQLEQKLEALANPQAVFVFSGSLCAGVEPGIYARYIRLVKNKGARAFLDADGEPFRLGLAANPDFIKPNIDELQAHFGLDKAPDTNEAIELCKTLIEGGVGLIALSRGKDGAIFLDKRSVIKAPGLKVKALSTVGAGDSMVGAMAYAADSGMDYESSLCLAMASSAGAVTTVGTKAPERRVVDELIKQVTLEKA